MTNFSRQDHTTKWLPIKEISVIWQQSQRNLDERKAKAIADAFDPEVFGVVTVCQANGAGVYHCIDGQHRVAAVRMALGENQAVPCNVISASDPKRAAQIFNVMNGSRSKPQAVDMFKVRVTAGEETEVAVNRTLNALGYRVAISSEDGTIRAVQTCCAVYRRFGVDVLRDAISTIKDTWGRSADAVDGHIINGFAEFLAEHGDKIDRKSLATKMARAYTPGRLIGAAKAGREMFKGRMGETISRLIMKTYDVGRRQGRLDEPKAA